MAERIAAVDAVTAGIPVKRAVWSGLLSGDTAKAVSFPDCTDATIAFTGTFSGATIALHGSLDGTNYFALTDPQGNAISKTSAALEAVSESPLDFKVVVSGGDGSTALVATLLAKRAAR